MSIVEDAVLNSANVYGLFYFIIITYKFKAGANEGGKSDNEQYYKKRIFTYSKENLYV